MELNKRELSNKLKNAMAEEHLWSRDAAALLNITPQYISLMLNSKYFDKVSAAAWKRLDAWSQTNDKLSNFKCPVEETQIQSKVNNAETIEPVVQPENTNAGNSTNLEVQEVKSPASLPIIQPAAKLEETSFDAGRIKLVLDIAINLTINGQVVNI